MTTNQQLFARRQAAVPRGPFHVAPIFVERAEGALLWDVEGNEYVDFCGGIGVLNVGHNHPKVVAAVKQQTERYLHTCFHVAMYEPYVRLAERLNAAAPIAGPCKTALFNSGAEAGENAVKIARAYTGRAAVVGFERAFHGRTLLGMTLTGKVKPYAAGFGPFAPEVYRLPYEPFFAPSTRSDAEVRDEARRAFERLTAYHVAANEIACLMVEPVLGEGGFMPIHPAAFRLLSELCRERGIVFVSDEVQSGFARCGALFACERYEGVEPDLLALAKSLGGGTVLSGVTGRAEIMDAPGVGGIGGTYGGNPLSCAAANAVLDVIEDEQLSARAKEIGEVVMTRFAALAAAHGFVGEPRGLGAMCGLPIIDDAGEADAARASAICREALCKGLLIMTASGNVLRTLMPLTITDAELEKGLDALTAAIATVAAA
jgi:4-aminobutyrate aminotransferase/(S)-3-amino-2-methylpropionate transaminase